MSYKVTGRGSKSIVSFSCPTCTATLESPLHEAGKRFPCPNCGKPFMTPGVEELKKLRADEAEAEALEAEAARLRSLEAKAKESAQPSPVALEQGRQEADISTLNYADPLGELASVAGSAPSTRFVEIPDYTRIRTGSYVLWVLSLLMYTIAAFFVVMMVIKLVSIARANVQQQSLSEPADLAIIAVYLGGITTYAILGALLGLLSSLSLAVRDMARNSFRR